MSVRLGIQIGGYWSKVSEQAGGGDENICN